MPLWLQFGLQCALMDSAVVKRSFVLFHLPDAESVPYVGRCVISGD